MCPPSGFPIVLSIACLRLWRLTNAYFNSAFLQAGHDARDVYVVPPRDFIERSHYFLLLTAAYGLVVLNSKCQDLSDSQLKELGLRQLSVIPQQFLCSGMVMYA